MRCYLVEVKQFTAFNYNNNFLPDISGRFLQNRANSLLLD